MFARDGFANVSMQDIADAVAVRPSALYRHFRSKDDLLFQVVHEALITLRAAVEEASINEDALANLTRTALDNRATGALWQRESRHLDPDLRAKLRAEVVATQREVKNIVARTRPTITFTQHDLLAWAIIDALTSISFQRIELPRADYEDLLAGIVDDALHAQLPRPTSATTVAADGLERASRRPDQLVAVATRLFAERGYQSVGIDDVAAATGITGPSVYKHFDSKLDLLVPVMMNGAKELQDAADHAISQAKDDREALRRLMASYAEFSFAHSDVMDLLIAETAHLPEPEHSTIREAQRAYIAQWASLLERVHPSIPLSHARVRLQAALSVTNDVARTPHLRANADTLPTVCAIGRAILRINAREQPMR